MRGASHGRKARINKKKARTYDAVHDLEGLYDALALLNQFQTLKQVGLPAKCETKSGVPTIYIIDMHRVTPQQ